MKLPWNWIQSDRFFGFLASWSCLLGGMALLGMMVLTPSWLGLQQMQAQQQALQVRAKQLQAYHESTVNIQKALEDDDPAMLEYLAYHFMGLKPHGLAALDSQTVRHQPDLNPTKLNMVPVDQQASLTHSPPYLVRLALGKGRLGVALLGLTGILIGLLLARRSTPGNPGAGAGATQTGVTGAIV